jgi:peptidoglycan/xylan/chitin deacetylase (PgdA/CDA1 family)
VVITFDDGYRDYHDSAYPVLREMGIRPAVFLATGHIDRPGMLWTETIDWAVMQSPLASASLPWAPETVMPMGTPALRVAFARACKVHLKAIGDEERRHWNRELLLLLKSPDPAKVLDRQMLTWAEVRASAAGTGYGGHSHTHPILAQVEDAALEREIGECASLLADGLGKPATLFAYPNGRACDFDERTRDAVKRHGFTLSYSTIPGINTESTDPFGLLRQHPWDSGVAELAALVARA